MGEASFLPISSKRTGTVAASSLGAPGLARGDEAEAQPRDGPPLGLSRTILGNLAAKSASEAILKIVRIGYLVLAARWLGRSGFGAYSYALALGAIVVSFADFGLQFHLAREIARNPKRAPIVWSDVLRSRAFLLLFVLPGIAASGVLFAGAADRSLIWLASGALLLASFVELGNYLFRGFQRLSYEARVNLLQAGVGSAAGLAAVRAGLGPIGLAAGALLGAGAALALSTFWIRKALAPLPGLTDLAPFRGRLDALRASWPIGGAILLSTLYFRIDVLFLGHYRGAETVGLYSAAYRIVESLLFLPAIFLAAVFPAFSEGAANETKRLGALFRASLLWLVAAAAPLSLALLFFAGPILRFLYGEAYLPGAIVLRILSPAVFLLFLNYALTHFLIALGRPRANMAIAGVCLAVNATSNAVLVPKYGMPAAAATTLLTEVVLFALALPPVRRGIGRVGS